MGALLVCLLLAAPFVWAQKAEPAEDSEPLAIIELGGAPSWSLSGEGASMSPTVAVEHTPIENWLELELGVTPTYSHRSREWDVDLLFKKPWTLSKKLELMAGIGPEWLHIRKNGATTNALAGEVALDLMFWPGRKRRFGLYIEPAYDRSFAAGHEQSIGMSGGLLIAIR